MKKINLLLPFIMASKLLFAQCDYFEDPNALRVNGSTSAPNCSSNFTYCSKNGFSISPYIQVTDKEGNRIAYKKVVLQ